ncbi:MAG: NAD(P)/FAD-dependent oxidoreductase [Planctomycetota bacterium]
MTTSFDVCVLGSGAVGQTVAYGGRKAGLSVVVLETQAPGGTCPNRGCDAKKPYVNAAGMMYRAGRLNAAGGGIEGPAINWRDIAAYTKTFTNPVGELTTRDVLKAGVELIQGHPTFVDPHTVEINGLQITAERFVLATGQMPRPLDVPGGELTINSDQLLDLDDLPRRVAFIGGGYVGMEFAGAAALSGHEVTVVTPGDHVLKGFEPEIVAVMEAALPDLGEYGVQIIPNRRVGSVTQSADGLTIHANDGDATALVTADLVVNTSGRVASVAGLNLDAAEIEVTPHGIAVDEHLRCPGNPRFWAGGDVADNGRPALIPTAVDDARVLAHNLFKAESEDELRTRSAAPHASIAFTTPPVASAGLTEAQARAKHGEIHVAGGNLATKKFYRELGQPHAAYKFIFNADRHLIGAHYTGESADEVINLLGLALDQPGETHPLFNATLTYPSVSSALQTAFRKALQAQA